MRRTLQTCNILFSDHPYKPKIIVDPGVRQIFSSSCDIGSRLIQSMIDFPEYNYDLISRPQLWYIDSLKNKQVQKELLGRVQKQINKAAINKEEKDKYKDKDKSSQILNKIGMEVMLDYLKQSQGSINQKSFSDFPGGKIRLKNEAMEYNHIAVVSHHDNIVAYTGKTSKNCQVLSFPAAEL